MPREILPPISRSLMWAVIWRTWAVARYFGFVGALTKAQDSCTADSSFMASYSALADVNRLLSKKVYIEGDTRDYSYCTTGSTMQHITGNQG
ncbi:hypothetical protein C8Q79DRAFT_82934 [Trametes meyenii]|nr:hypothetical protein C8Q79DRAFT_82934 [Trametes meyenii]